LEVARETIGSAKSQKGKKKMDYLMRLLQKSGKREKQKAKIRTDIKNHFSTLLFIFVLPITYVTSKENKQHLLCCRFSCLQKAQMVAKTRRLNH